MNTGGKLYFPGSSDRIDQLQYVSVVDGKQNTFLGQECGNKFPGEYNVFSGYRSGQKSVDVTTSLFSGAKSGQNAQRIQETVMVGYEAGQSSADSNSNVLIGSYAGRGLQRSRFNVAVGYRAMAGAVSGLQNTAVGAYAAMSAQSLANSVTIGFYCGEHLRGSNNTYVGAFCGSNATSSDSTVIGFKSAQQLAGNAVTVVGVSVLEHGMNLADSVALGAFAGQNVRDGGNMVVIGSKAMQMTRAAYDVVAIGKGAFQYGDSASSSIIVGTGAGGNTTTILDSTIIGHDAADMSTFIQGSIVVGKDALGGANGTTTSSVVVGTGAGTSSGTITNTTLIGYGTGKNVEAVLGSVGIGTDVFRDAAGGITDCVTIGAQAATSLTSMSKSVIIGMGAATRSDGLIECTVIGYLAAADSIDTFDGITAIGNRAMMSATNSNYTTAVGVGAFGTAIATGEYNSFLGYISGSMCVGSYNTVIGARAAEGLEGSDNVVIGSRTLTGLLGPIRLENSVVIGRAIEPGLMDSCIIIGSNYLATDDLNDSIVLGTGIVSGDHGIEDNSFFVGVTNVALLKVTKTEAYLYCPDATAGNSAVSANVVDNDTSWTGGTVVQNGGLKVYNGIKLYGSSGSMYAQNRLVAGATGYAAGMSGQRLYVDGNAHVTGFLQKGGGTFDIQHPFLSSKRLIHSFVEGPRCDLIYRGTVQLIDGAANVIIDTECVKEAECGMTIGTFESLVANPDVYLQNQTGFDRVRGWVDEGILRIVCENPGGSDSVSWMVIGERKDSLVKNWNKTNAHGYLKTEYASTT